MRLPRTADDQIDFDALNRVVERYPCERFRIADTLQDVAATFEKKE